MTNLGEFLRGSEAVRAAFEISKELDRKVCLVGGTVRDLLLKSGLGNDYDFVVEGKGLPFARAFADKVGGSFFILDEKRDASRVVSKKGFQADFSGVRGSIEEDLRLRDFTVNSMAIPVDSVFGVGIPVLLDPLGGLSDINSGVLRASSLRSLKEDPLRILRAFRFSSAFGFRIDNGLLEQIREGREALTGVSAERLRSELFMILDAPGAYDILEEMDEAGVLNTLFPEVGKWKGFYQGGWHLRDLFNHSMKTVAAAEEVLSHLNRYFPRHFNEVESHMGEEIEACVTRRGLLKLASLLHDSGKLYTRVMEGDRGRFFGHDKAGERLSASIAKGLKLSRRSEIILKGLTSNHMRILGLSKLKRVTGRAKYRFFRDAEGFGPDLLVLALADAQATPIEGNRLEEFNRLVGALADYYYEEFTPVPQRPLLTGEEIMRAFGIPQGKQIGEMLDALREAEMTGKVTNKREAINYLKKWSAA